MRCYGGLGPSWAEKGSQHGSKLVPKMEPESIKKSKFISNPGCYPTSILIPLIPLLEKKIINAGHIIIDSKSGVSGAGKKRVEENLSAELNNNFYSYSVTSHKHFPEIDQEIKKVSNSCRSACRSQTVKKQKKKWGTNLNQVGTK